MLIHETANKKTTTQYLTTNLLLRLHTYIGIIMIDLILIIILTISHSNVNAEFTPVGLA